MARMIKVGTAFIASVIMIGFMLVMGGPATAATFGQCDESVVDRTSQKVLDVSKVGSAVMAADRNGVDLYVRAFQKTPDSSLDQYWQDSVRKCANWRSGSGSDARPKGNVALIAFSMDHKSAIFYGPVYDDLIGDTNANKIRTQMGSFFRNGDFTGGVTFAAGRIGALAGGNAAAPADQPVSQPVSSTDKWTMPWGVVWPVLLGLAILVLLIVAAIAVTKTVRRRREVMAELAFARNDALTARRTASGYVTKWSGTELTSLDSDLELELVMLPESRQSTHRREAEHVKALLNKGMDDFSAAANTDVDSASLTREQYDQATGSYDAVNRRFTMAEAELTKFRQAVKDDIAALDPTRQEERITAIADKLNCLLAELDTMAGSFTVVRERKQAASLTDGVVKTRTFVAGRTDAAKALTMIDADETAVTAFESDIAALRQARTRFADPLATMRATVEAGRSKVRKYRAGSDKALIDLDALDDSLRSKLRFFGPDKDRETGQTTFDNVESQIALIVRRAKKAHDEDERKKRRDREVSLPRTRRSPSSGGYGSGGDSFGGGFAGGFLGGSLGSSGGGSSDSGSSWGGGSSGGFDGGGSSGGGDSGGW